MENINETIKKAEEKLAEIRSAKKELEQKEALANSPVKENRTAERNKFYSDIQSAMKENRTVKVNGTGTVSVANELIYALEDKDDLLSKFSIHAGASASNVIPVWNNSIGEFAPVEEDGTFVSAGDGLASITVEPKAFAKSIKVSDETLKLSAVEFESALNKILMDSTRRTILKGIFNGVADRFVAIDTGATEVNVAKIDPAAIQKLALTVLSKTDSAVILINPMTYAGIVDSNTKKDEILLKQLIENKNIEGVDVLLSSAVPADKVIAGDLGNYGIGIANEMEITPKTAVGSLAHTYDASIYVAGKPIIAKDFFVLKVN
jgi:phage capsid family|nr:MAG TPA: major capsid protein [Caudoviricetes sp.]